MTWEFVQGYSACAMMGLVGMSMGFLLVKNGLFITLVAIFVLLIVAMAAIVRQVPERFSSPRPWGVHVGEAKGGRSALAPAGIPAEGSDLTPVSVAGAVRCPICYVYREKSGYPENPPMWARYCSAACSAGTELCPPCAAQHKNCPFCR